jgi:hypothetical protein
LSLPLRPRGRQPAKKSWWEGAGPAAGARSRTSLRPICRFNEAAAHVPQKPFRQCWTKPTMASFNEAAEHLQRKLVAMVLTESPEFIALQ